MDTLNEPIPDYGPALIRAYEQERDAMPVYTPGSGKALRFLELLKTEVPTDCEPER